MSNRKIDRSVQDVLVAARRVLAFARTGEQDFRAGGARREPGLYAAITSGRSVTNVIQGLRSKVDDFDSWWGTALPAHLAGPVPAWFVQVRNDIEKRGTIGPHGSAMSIISLDGSAMEQNAPPGATGFFMGDHLGRSGYFVLLPDGTQETIYFSLPADVVLVEMIVDDAPGNRPIGELLAEYLDSTERLLAAAEEKYGQSTSRPM